MNQVFPDIFKLNSLIANTYLLVEPNDLTLIDTGVPGTLRWLIRDIERLGFSLKDIKTILVTHSDSDHSGNLQAIKTLSRAKTCTSRIEAAAIQHGKASRLLKPKGLEKVFYGLTSRMFSARPAEIDRILEPGMILPIMGGMKVLDTQGHTPGHLSFFLEKSRILFAGDSIWRINHIPAPSRGANTWDSDLAKKSFDFQMQFKPTLICAGHTLFNLGAIND